MPAQVIESKVWKAPDGRTFSLYSGYVPPGSELVARGWTIQHPDGTVGIGRPPFATPSEAQAWIDAHPHFPGMSQD
jgi:hypothetical protein